MTFTKWDSKRNAIQTTCTQTHCRVSHSAITQVSKSNEKGQMLYQWKAPIGQSMLKRSPLPHAELHYGLYGGVGMRTAGRRWACLVKAFFPQMANYIHSLGQETLKLQWEKLRLLNYSQSGILYKDYVIILNTFPCETADFILPVLELPTPNSLYCGYSVITLFFVLTRTVAILLGNAFARIENDAVIAAAKDIASIALTKKQKPMNIGPLGTLSNILGKKKSKCRPYWMQQDIKNGSGTSLLLVKGHNCKTHNTFYCCIFLNHTSIVIQTLPNLFWHLYPFPLSLMLQKGRKRES